MEAACVAISSASSTLLNDPPTIATCFPLKSSGEVYDEECEILPVKFSRPGIGGIYGSEKNPHAKIMQSNASFSSLPPLLHVITHLLSVLERSTFVTLHPNDNTPESR